MLQIQMIPFCLWHPSHYIHPDNIPEVREQYEKDYPVVNIKGKTEHARRGMPDGHDDRGNPTYLNGVPPGVKLKMMHSSLAPTKAKASYTYSYTPGREPWVKDAFEIGRAESEPKTADREDASEEDSNSDPITGGLGHGLVIWPPKRTPSPYGHHYTEGDEWQQAGDTCGAERRCGGGGSARDNQNSRGAGPSSTQSQIDSNFKYRG